MIEHTSENEDKKPAAEEASAGETEETAARAMGTGAAGASEAAPEAANDTGDDANGDPGDEDPQAARIAELEAALAEQKESALRALAEAENMRKRAEKQVQDASRYGAAGFARDMLVVADNLERALAAVPDDANGGELLANLREGVEMTLRDLESKLENHAVRKLAPEPGEKFDHNLHQAMFEAETDEHPAGTIAQVVQHGYMLHDRLLRAAMVGVAKAPGDAASSGEAENDNAA